MLTPVFLIGSVIADKSCTLRSRPVAETVERAVLVIKVVGVEVVVLHMGPRVSTHLTGKQMAAVLRYRCRALSE